MEGDRQKAQPRPASSASVQVFAPKRIEFFALLTAVSPICSSTTGDREERVLGKRKVQIVVASGTVSEADTLRGLIAALDCTHIAEDRGDADVVVVLFADGQAIDQTLDQAVTGAFDLIGVYAPTFTGAVPLLLEDFATAIVTLDPVRLNEAICEEQDIWLDPSGDPWTPRPTKRECLKSNC